MLFASRFVMLVTVCSSHHLPSHGQYHTIFPPATQMAMTQTTTMQTMTKLTTTQTMMQTTTRTTMPQTLPPLQQRR
jgi:hypothetical protein